MKREIGWDAIHHDPASVATVGTFDGVHRGHQAIIEYLLRRADEQGGTSTLISFDPHPRSVVHNQDVPLLTTLDERGDVLEELGLDRFVVIPFSTDFARIDPVDYVEDVLVRRVGLREITVGYDHRFGRKRKGDVDLLRRMGEKHGFDVDVIPAQTVNDDVVSSSAVREALLADGDADRARNLLGRPYALRGRVERGDGRGRKIGFPTANIAVESPDKLIPKIGVYAVHVLTPDGQRHRGMMNIGRRPTFDKMDVTVEVHLLDFEGDLYGENLTVQFLRRLRDERKFDGVESLVAQLSQDKNHCIEVLEALD